MKAAIARICCTMLVAAIGMMIAWSYYAWQVGGIREGAALAVILAVGLAVYAALSSPEETTR